MLWLPGVVAALAAGIATAISVPVAIRLAQRLGAVDEPGGRKEHNGAVPRLGGAAIALGLIVGVGLVLPAVWADTFVSTPLWKVALLAAAVGTVFFVGLLDDIQEVPVSFKLLLEVFVAAVIAQAGWAFTTLTVPFVGPMELGLLGPALSVLWIVGITNAINLLDGLDGLAAGVVAIISSSLFILSLTQANLGATIGFGAVAGACLGFLRFNWSPAKIFLGDSGSLTLGFVLACLTLHSSLKASAAVVIFVPILALGLPAIDTLLVMASRFARHSRDPLLARVGKVFQADRQHVHHLVSYLSPRRASIVLWLYGIAAGFCVLALGAALIGNPLVAALVVLIQVVAVAVIRRAGMRAKARDQAAADHPESAAILNSRSTAEQEESSVARAI